ncbi:hypothetical protein AJ80_02097 [Polytolypa hystricis UAMH7299]|uniref:Uncharacterized protein n=1 Tax=Polytolypa hystricis (strain UAMH7299) TaxID=1447883 RepID=A0A2B7YS24_POLH7|nr:hypothetical protein AJ80_02097 [Polytolypa hystricis UAMH7299]
MSPSNSSMPPDPNTVFEWLSSVDPGDGDPAMPLSRAIPSFWHSKYGDRNSRQSVSSDCVNLRTVRRESDPYALFEGNGDDISSPSRYMSTRTRCSQNPHSRPPSEFNQGARANSSRAHFPTDKTPRRISLAANGDGFQNDAHALGANDLGPFSSTPHNSGNGMAASEFVDKGQRTVYGRKPRHKTRRDRYEPKGVAEPSERTSKGRCKKKTTKLKTKRKSHAAGNENGFRAYNVSRDRLTLNSSFDLGLFRKGRASSPVGRLGRPELPDLSFSEMAFLSKGSQQKPQPLSKVPPSNVNGQNDKVTLEEISKYFSCQGPSKSRQKTQYPATSPHLPIHIQDNVSSVRGEACLQNAARAAPVQSTDCSPVTAYLSWSETSKSIACPSTTSNRDGNEDNDKTTSSGYKLCNSYGAKRPPAAVGEPSPMFDKELDTRVQDAVFQNAYITPNVSMSTHSKPFYNLDDLQSLAKSTCADVTPTTQDTICFQSNNIGSSCSQAKETDATSTYDMRRAPTEAQQLELARDSVYEQRRGDNEGLVGSSLAGSGVGNRAVLSVSGGLPVTASITTLQQFSAEGSGPNLGRRDESQYAFLSRSMNPSRYVVSENPHTSTWKTQPKGPSYSNERRHPPSPRFIGDEAPFAVNTGTAFETPNLNENEQENRQIRGHTMLPTMDQSTIGEHVFDDLLTLDPDVLSVILDPEIDAPEAIDLLPYLNPISRVAHSDALPMPSPQAQNVYTSQLPPYREDLPSSVQAVTFSSTKTLPSMRPFCRCSISPAKRSQYQPPPSLTDTSFWRRNRLY